MKFNFKPMAGDCFYCWAADEELPYQVWVVADLVRPAFGILMSDDGSVRFELNDGDNSEVIFDDDDRLKVIGSGQVLEIGTHYRGENLLQNFGDHTID